MFSNEYEKARNCIIDTLTANLDCLEREARSLRPVKPLEAEKFAAIANAYANTANTLLALMREQELDEGEEYDEDDEF